MKEVLFAQRLADNDKKIRDRAIKKLKKYLSIKSSGGAAICEEDALKLWKGLFYCMYMADKPLVQEAVAEEISSLIQYINNEEDCRNFVKAGFLTFAREWNGIDVFRIDKYMMFVRRFLRHVFNHLRADGWKLKDVMAYVSILETVVICPNDNVNATSMGLKTHVCEIILEELAKVGGESLQHSVVMAVIHPYFKVLALTKMNAYIKFVREGIIRHLIRQTLCGKEEEEADATGIEDTAEREEESDEKMEEELESPLDPRAGKVDAYLPVLKVDLNLLADSLQKVGAVSRVQTKNREVIYRLVCELRDAAQGHDPLAIPQDNVKDVEVPEMEVEKAIERLEKFEDDLREGRKIEDEENDNDLKPVKKSQFKNKYQKLKYLRLKKKKKLQPKGLSKGKKKKLDERQQKIAQKRTLAVDLMAKRVAGVSRSNKINQAPSEQVKSNHGFEVSPIAKKKKVNTPSKTPTNDFTVEVTLVGKKKRKNVQTTVNRSKKKCFDVSVLDLQSNGKTEMSTLKDSGNTSTSVINKTKTKEENNKMAIKTQEAKAPTSVISKGLSKEKNKKIASKVQKTKAPASACNGNVAAVNEQKQQVKGKELLDAPIHVEKVSRTERQPSQEKTTQDTNTKVANNNTTSSKSKCLIMNLSQNKKQKGLRSLTSPKKSPWDEPLKNGEYEVFIKSKKQGRKTKEKKMSSIKKRLAASIPKQRTISINLKKNKEHEFSDYVRTLRASPCIPFRADLAPKAPVLKPSPSPILVKGPIVRKRLQRKAAASASPQLSLKKYRQTASDFF